MNYFLYFVIFTVVVWPLTLWLVIRHFIAKQKEAKVWENVLRAEVRVLEWSIAHGGRYPADALDAFPPTHSYSYHLNPYLDCTEIVSDSVEVVHRPGAIYYEYRRHGTTESYCIRGYDGEGIMCLDSHGEERTVEEEVPTT